VVDKGVNKVKLEKEELKGVVTKKEEIKKEIKEEPKEEDLKPVEKVVEKPAKLEFYIMSKCPYGSQVVQAISPALKNWAQPGAVHRFHREQG